MQELTKAQVVAQAAPDGVYVMLPSGQIPGYPVKVGFQGPADAMRVKKTALPTPGTWGIVLFPAGDVRNGVWMTSYYAQKVTAFDSTTDPHQEYDSHYSGYYRSLDQNGNENIVFPDGTAIVVSSTGAVASTQRQTVTPEQAQESVPFTADQRVPNPPSPFYLAIRHISGTSIVISPSGAITIIGVEDIDMTASGDVNITAQNATITATTATVDSPNTTCTGNLIVDGNLTVG